VKTVALVDCPFTWRGAELDVSQSATGPIRGGELGRLGPAVAGLPVRQSDRLVPRGEPGELVLERAGSQ